MRLYQSHALAASEAPFLLLCKDDNTYHPHFAAALHSMGGMTPLIRTIELIIGGYDFH